MINDEVATDKFYLDEQESSRLTSQFSAKHKITSTNTISLRNSISLFERKINIDENIEGNKNLYSIIHQKINL